MYNYIKIFPFLFSDSITKAGTLLGLLEPSHPNWRINYIFHRIPQKQLLTARTHKPRDAIDIVVNAIQIFHLRSKSVKFVVVVVNMLTTTITTTALKSPLSTIKPIYLTMPSVPPLDTSTKTHPTQPSTSLSASSLKT